MKKILDIQIAVCGRFHYHNYIGYLHKAGILKTFIYSHKVSSKANLFDLPHNKRKNIFIKEYTLRFLLKVLNRSLRDVVVPFSNEIWQNLAVSKIEKSDIFHFMLHGTSPKLIEKAIKYGSIILGEPVNSHPDTMIHLLQTEYDHLKICKKNIFSPKTYKYFKEEIQATDYLLTGSSWIKKSFLENGYDEKKIFTIPYGVNLSNFYALTGSSKKEIFEKKDFKVLCVASINPRKGQIYLLEAFKRLNIPNSELILVGAIDPDMHEILNRYSGFFTHIPFCDHQQLKNIYNSADVFVLPSIEDGFAYVTTEAMACGLPVIVSENAGSSEIIDHEIDGFVIPPRSVEAIMNHLSFLYRNSEARIKISEAARIKVTQTLSWEKYSEKLIELYEQIANL